MPAALFPTDPGAAGVGKSDATVMATDHAAHHNLLASGYNAARGQLLASHYIDVRSYGAVFDGTTDDTAEIQAAFDAAADSGPKSTTIVMPAGTAKITSELVLGPSGSSKSINLVGQGGLSTYFQYDGPGANACLRIRGMKRYYLAGFSLFTNASGTGTGIRVKRGSGSGTQSFNAHWDGITVENFAKGVHIGDDSIGEAASEMLFNCCAAYNCTTGFWLEDYNSLDFKFVMVSIGENDTGIYASTASQVFVDGGSSSNSSVADFHVETAGAYSICNFRSETANRFLIGGATGAHTPITVQACHVAPISNADKIAVEGWGNLILIGNHIQGKIDRGSVGSLTMIGTGVEDTVPWGGDSGHRAVVLQCPRLNADGTIHSWFANDLVSP